MEIKIISAVSITVTEDDVRKFITEGIRKENPNVVVDKIEMQQKRSPSRLEVEVEGHIGDGAETEAEPVKPKTESTATKKAEKAEKKPLLKELGEKKPPTKKEQAAADAVAKELEELGVNPDDELSDDDTPSGDLTDGVAPSQESMQLMDELEAIAEAEEAAKESDDVADDLFEGDDSEPEEQEANPDEGDDEDSLADIFEGA